MRRLLVLLALLLALPDLASAETIRRFALLFGAHDGGVDRVRLRYAGSDARAVARVLEELGGVAPADRLLVEDPDRREVQRAFAAMGERIAEARGRGERVELFVYYSGHSDEEGLLLGGERFGYAELRQALESLPADVRVAILDSCSSGALTRAKGGVHRPPFLLDTSTRVHGHAYLTASSADEAAQESDRIRASFFTHSLVSGLRGAADATGDGKVTLTEAYQFAFQETLARTEQTNAGAQHPAWEMQLVGTGDLVITDLRSTAARLVVEQPIAGRIFVRDASGALVVELRKTVQAPVELGLAPGTYRVTVDEGGRLRAATIDLSDARPTVLRADALRPVEGERNRLRGDGPRGDDAYVPVPFVLALSPRIHTLPPDVSPDRAILRVGFHVGVGRTARLDGVDLGFGLSWHDESAKGAMLTLGGNLVGEEMEGAQIAVGFNQARRLRGFQGSVFFNGTEEGGAFAQSATALNFSGGRFEGAQLSAGLNLARQGFEGAQIASGVNWVEREAKGLQAAAGVNWAADAFEGAQIGTVNLGRTTVEGAQVGVVNWVGERQDGIQVAVVNVGPSIDGVQIGVVNVASGRVEGTQIGVVNYADDVDAPIGLVSVVRRGIFHLDLRADEVAPVQLGSKLGGRILYGILTAGIGGEGYDGERLYTLGAGLGVRLRVDRPALSTLDVELLQRSALWGVSRRDVERLRQFQQIASLRLAAGWRLAPRFALFAGPSLNLSWAEREEGERGAFGFFGRRAVLYDGAHRTTRLWPGFFAGVEI